MLLYLLKNTSVTFIAKLIRQGAPFKLCYYKADDDKKKIYNRLFMMGFGVCSYVIFPKNRVKYYT